MLEKLKKWNVWWTEKKVFQNQKGIVRKKVLDDLSLLMASKEMIVLTGVRRSGKSTLMFQLIDRLLEQGVAPENILYFNFDEPLEQGSVQEVELVYQAYIELHNPKGRRYVFFDEIQNVKDWERWIKKSYDYFGREVKFILTGSNNTMLHDSLAKLLTGRTLSKTVYPLSFEEFLYFNTVKISDQDVQKSEIRHHLSKFIEKGGFPEVVLSRDEFVNSRRLKEYFDSIILRDVAQPQNIREISKLIELANFSMTNVSSLMSYNNISKAIGLNITSLKDYLLFLENA
ncbi:MAG: ATP-binding protein, partial [Nanoarchaeota archaeon]